MKKITVKTLENVPLQANEPGKVVGNFPVEVFTPEMAANILAHFNSDNRPVNQGKADIYTRDMKAKRWRLTNDCLVFAEDGTCLNGQHRLWAVFMSCIAQPFGVIRNATREDMLAMDDGARRTVGQQLVFQHALDTSMIHKASLVTSTINAMLRSWSRYSKAEVKAFYELHHEAINFVVSRVKKTRKNIATGPVMGALALAWYYLDDKVPLERFIDILNTGVCNGPDESAAIKFRDWLKDMEGHKSGADRAKLVALYAHGAIRAFINGTPVARPTPAKDYLYNLPEIDPTVGVKHGATSHRVAWYRERYSSSVLLFHTNGSK